MSQVRIVFVSGETLPVDVYISDIYGNNQFKLGTIIDTVPPEVVYNTTIPQIFQSAPEIQLTLIDSNKCKLNKNITCTYGCLFDITVEVAP